MFRPGGLGLGGDVHSLRAATTARVGVDWWRVQRKMGSRRRISGWIVGRQAVSEPHGVAGRRGCVNHQARAAGERGVYEQFSLGIGREAGLRLFFARPNTM